jgi:hypothetical protein
MDFLKRFKKQYAARADAPLDPYADDEVYPVHTLDDTKTFRNIIITWTLCFNDVLDTDKLQSSLARLLESGDWRKLGGRLRLNVSGFSISLSPCRSSRANILDDRTRAD